jgi:hypothetical protein
VDLSAELRERQHAAAVANEANAADRRAQVEREEEMVRAMRAMETVLVESAEREEQAAEREERALRRAEAAEDRESAARERSEAREKRLVWFAAASLIVAVLSFVVPAIS